MATLDPPFGTLAPGKHELQINALGWHTVGSCMLTKNDEFHFAASGNYNALGRSGTFDIALTLTDRSPTAASGPCTATYGGQTLAGTYTRSGKSISFTDGQHTIAASPDGNDVILRISGYPKARIRA